MPAPEPAVNTAHCPLCGAGNGCAMAVPRAPGEAMPRCWCMDADFPDALLRRVPTAARGRACICARCAAEAARAPVHGDCT